MRQFRSARDRRAALRPEGALRDAAPHSNGGDPHVAAAAAQRHATARGHRMGTSQGAPGGSVPQQCGCVPGGGWEAQLCSPQWCRPRSSPDPPPLSHTHTYTHTHTHTHNVHTHTYTYTHTRAHAPINPALKRTLTTFKRRVFDFIRTPWNPQTACVYMQSQG